MTDVNHSNTFLVAIVTGAARGIGREISLRLATDGLAIAVVDLRAKSLELQETADGIKKLGGLAIQLFCDVSVEEEVKDMVKDTVRQLGRLDVMVANAGISMRGPLVDTQTDLWDKVMAVNIRGTMLCYKYAAQQMIQQGRGGRIIGASSAHGKSATRYLSAYSATKFAIRGLTQSAAQELAEHNITVNTYAPGLILTPMTVTDAERQAGGRPGNTMTSILKLPPDCPRAGPDVVASVVSYLVKPEAYFITGQSISMNGGVIFD